MALALFDLDNTLLHGDSDYLWGEFLVEIGVVDGDHYQRENQRFFDAYKAGHLDIMEFLAFSLEPLSRHSPDQLRRWHLDFMDRKIRPIILPAAVALVESHRVAGDTPIIITATNRFVTEPIADEFNVTHLLATEIEQTEDGGYTGRPSGVPCFRDGKVQRLDAWMAEHGESLDGSSFYSDSHNDLPLLERVERPCAVDPDEKLRAVATRRSWPILSLSGS